MGVDLDGTLLNSEKMVTDENAKAIEAMENKGIKVTIFTGRSWISGREYLKNIRSDIPAVFQNGAYITTSKSNKVLREVLLDATMAHEVIKKARIYDFFCFVTKDFLNVPDIIHEMDVPAHSKFAYYFKRNSPRMQKVKDVLKEVKGDVAGITWVGPLKEVKKVISELSDIYKNEMTIIIDTILGEEVFVEFIGRNCGKETAMDFLLNYYDLSYDEAAFIGDSYNDVGALQLVSHPIAMGNSPREIKEMAEFVTHTNDENGFAHAVHNFILKESDLVDQNCHIDDQ